MNIPRILLQGRQVFFHDKRVGRYGQILRTGEKVFVCWKVFYDYGEGYSMSVDLLDSLDEDVETFFIVDKHTHDVYRFPRETYETAPLTFHNNQKQLCPSLHEATGYWEDAVNDIVIR